MARPCSKCHRRLEFVDVPGRNHPTLCDYMPARVLVDKGGPWIGWDQKSLAAVHGWVLDRTQDPARHEELAQRKCLSLAWAWVPHFRSCPFAERKGPPPAEQPQAKAEQKPPQPVEQQGRLF